MALPCDPAAEISHHPPICDLVIRGSVLLTKHSHARLCPAIQLLVVFTGSEGNYPFHRIGLKGRTWQHIYIPRGPTDLILRSGKIRYFYMHAYVTNYVICMYV